MREYVSTAEKSGSRPLEGRLLPLWQDSDQTCYVLV